VLDEVVLDLCKLAIRFSYESRQPALGGENDDDARHVESKPGAVPRDLLELEAGVDLRLDDYALPAFWIKADGVRPSVGSEILTDEIERTRQLDANV
jgi:hypothetical protein